MIVDDLINFRNKLLEYYVYRKKQITNHEKLTRKESEDRASIYNEISVSAGKYAPLVKEYTGLESIHTSAGLQDVWNWAFSFEANTLVLSALNDCIQATGRVIGKLEDDIKKGKRDKRTGELITTDDKTNKKVIEVPPESIFRETPPQAFISHGKESVALRKLKEFLETLGIEPLIVKKQASLDKNVPDKVNLYLGQADFVIILATGDDTVTDKKTGKEIIQPRQNVIHEIGLAQKTHPGRIIYLLEEGAEFPSNIRPKVWESFKQRNMMDAFLGIVRELRAYGILKATKFPIEEHQS